MSASRTRDGKRTPRSDRAKIAPHMAYYLIVTDTEETEKNYFGNMRDNMSPEQKQKVVITTVRAKKTSRMLERFDDFQEELAKHKNYAERWIVFDRDTVTRFDEIIDAAQKMGIHTGWSNPCIETWFSCYFGYMLNEARSTECVEKFKRLFKEETSKKYTKSMANIYTLLTKFGDEAKAIANAELKTKEQEQQGKHKPSQMLPCTTMHVLISSIRGKVGNK